MPIAEKKDNISVTLTTKCQMRCRYCFINQGKPDITESMLYKAIDLLMTSENKLVELQFFGGEPLLRFDLVRKSIKYADRKAKEKRKDISYLVTTNGLLMDKEKIKFFKSNRTNVLMSLDGSIQTLEKNRPVNKREASRNSHALLLTNARAMLASGLPHFINIVYDKNDIRGLKENVDFLKKLGFMRMQLSYAVGSRLDGKDAKFVYDKLRDIFDSFPQITFQNKSGENEPTLATPQITVDTEGNIFKGCALVLERSFGQFHRSRRISHLNKCLSLTEIKSSAINETADLLKNRGRVPAILLENLKFGITLKKLLNKNER